MRPAVAVEIDKLLAIAAEAAATAAALIDALDDADGDADLEPVEEDEEGGESEPSLGSLERRSQAKWAAGGVDDLEEQCEGGGGEEGCEDEGADTGDKEPWLGWPEGSQYGNGGDGDLEGPDHDREPSMGWQNPMGETPPDYDPADGTSGQGCDGLDGSEWGRPADGARAAARELLATIPASRRRHRGGNVRSLDGLVVIHNGMPYRVGTISR